MSCDLGVGVWTEVDRCVCDRSRPLVQPRCFLQTVQEMIETTYPAANDLISRMAELEILKEITGQTRNRRFMYVQYVRLFSEES